MIMKRSGPEEAVTAHAALNQILVMSNFPLPLLNLQEPL